MVARELEIMVLAGVRALVIEDDLDVRDLIEEILFDAGAQVMTASTSEEGLGAVTGFLPNVIVTDIHLPCESGFWFLGRLRGLPAAQGGLLPVVAMSGGVSASETLSAGFCAHLTKPMDIAELLEVVRQYGSRGASGR